VSAQFRQHHRKQVSEIIFMLNINFMHHFHLLSKWLLSRSFSAICFFHLVYMYSQSQFPSSIYLNTRREKISPFLIYSTSVLFLYKWNELDSSSRPQTCHPAFLHTRHTIPHNLSSTQKSLQLKNFP